MQINMTTEEIRILVLELKAASSSFDYNLITTDKVVRQLGDSWKSPRINQLLGEYDLWRKRQKDQSNLLFELAKELEHIAEANEQANR